MSKSSQPHRVPPYRRPLIIGGFLLIVSIVGFATVLICKSLNQSTPDDNTTSQVSNSNSSSSSSSSQPTSEGSTDTSEPPLENKAPQYEGEDPNSLPSLTGVLAYADIDPDTQSLHSAVSINQYLADGGQCVFNLKRGEVVLRTTSAPASPAATTSACGPFTLSLTDLDSGTYDIEVIITGDGKRGVITDQITL